MLSQNNQHGHMRGRIMSTSQNCTSISYFRNSKQQNAFLIGTSLFLNVNALSLRHCLLHMEKEGENKTVSLYRRR
jgi:hypothetical protein